MKRLALVASAAAATTILLASPALAGAPSVTMDPAGVLSTDGRQVTVSGTYRCDPVPGGVEKLFLNVTQPTRGSKAQAAGFAVTCTGLPETYAATLTVVSPTALAPGPAVGQATITGSSGSANNTPGQAMVLV